MTTTAAVNVEKASALLTAAVNDPGVISAAYSQFHNYSFGNLLSAAVQCAAREIPFGPISTYPGWLKLGRQVQKGQKALTLCQPVTMKRKGEPANDDEAETFTRFIFQSRWFVLSQTEGEDMAAQPCPTWDGAQALAALDIVEERFAHVDGNAQGYAKARTIAINPVSLNPHKTRFHELAHVLLGHTSEGELSDDARTPRNLRELEAEAVAMLCCDAIGLGGAAESRGYIQSWWGAGHAIPDASAIKILKVTDQILKAGRPAPEAAAD